MSSSIATRRSDRNRWCSWWVWMSSCELSLLSDVNFERSFFSFFWWVSRGPFSSFGVRLSDHSVVIPYLGEYSILTIEIEGGSLLLKTNGYRVTVKWRRGARTTTKVQRNGWMAVCSWNIREAKLHRNGHFTSSNWNHSVTLTLSRHLPYMHVRS